MKDVSMRAILVAVSIFVTMIIVTILFGSFNTIKEIYGTVNKVNNSIYDTFNDIYAMYNGKTENGIGLLNTIKKYEDNDSVLVRYPQYQLIQGDSIATGKREVEYLKTLMENEEEYNRNVI